MNNFLVRSAYGVSCSCGFNAMGGQGIGDTSPEECKGRPLSFRPMNKDDIKKARRHYAVLVAKCDSLPDVSP